MLLHDDQTESWKNKYLIQLIHHHINIFQGDFTSQRVYFKSTNKMYGDWSRPPHCVSSLLRTVMFNTTHYSNTQHYLTVHTSLYLSSLRYNISHKIGGVIN